MSTQLQTQSKASSKLSDALTANNAVKRHFSSQRGFSTEAQRYPIQAKLRIGQPGDKYEQEADQVADQVIRMPDPGNSLSTGFTTPGQPPIIQRMCPECEEELNRKPISIQRVEQSTGHKIQRQCTECEEEIQRQPIEEEEEEELQMKQGESHTPMVTPEIHDHINSLRGRGQPLLQTTRSFFEPRFGYDLRDVRIHTDSASSDVAKSINARAFTLGNHVVMNKGEYQPDSSTGKRLLGHELTHVVQQNARSNGAGVTRCAISTHSNAGHIQRAAPAAAGISIGAVVAKCIIGAIVGVIFDFAIQGILHSIKKWTWRFWKASWDYCSIILSAVLGCIAAPISAAILEPWVVARLGPKLGGMAGTLLGKILLFIAKKLAMGIPKGIVKSLAKLGCISPEQAKELGVTRQEPEEDEPTEPVPETPAVPGVPATTTCKPMSGDVFGDARILMKIDTADFLNKAQEVKMDKFSDLVRGTGDKVVIHGLASVDGPASYNDKLSCSRALSARQMLQDRGITSGQINDLFKHGEVPGDFQQQRSVVLERVSPAGPKPGVPKPKPGKPVPPTSVTPSPAASLKSVHFRSDHGKLKNNTESWADTGALYSEPEWQDTNPDGVSSPISHTKDGTVKVAATVSFQSVPKSGVPVVLKGEGPQGFLTFQASGNLDGKKEQVFMLNSNSKIPDEIAEYLNQMIVWSISIHNETKLIGISAGHDVFATYTVPAGGVTYKRMAKATELARGFGNKPHDIVSGQMARFPAYNLDRAYENAWKVADDLSTAADCQTIVRFIQGVNDMVGLPGVSRGLSIYADPYGDPTVPKHGVLTPKGGTGMHNYPPQPGTGYKAGLFDEGDNYNNYEAALEFKHSSQLLYYPGGVTPAGKGMKAMKDVLYVFKQMAWGEYDPVLKKTLPRVAIYCYKQKKTGSCS